MQRSDDVLNNEFIVCIATKISSMIFVTNANVHRETIPSVIRQKCCSEFTENPIEVVTNIGSNIKTIQTAVTITRLVAMARSSMNFLSPFTKFPGFGVLCEEHWWFYRQLNHLFSLCFFH